MCPPVMAIQVPVADSMIQFAKRAEHPFHEFMCYWTAFNNLYAVMAAAAGQGPGRKKKDKEVCGIQIPDFRSNEYDQIRYIQTQFCPALKHELILHESTGWFVNRTPRWQGNDITHDAEGHRLNGVINVGFTFDVSAPVWSPICAPDYQAYKEKPHRSMQDALVGQIVDVLYTVRNNLIHAGKNPDDSTDQDVTARAVPLLKIIFSHFLPSIVATQGT